MSNSIKGKAMAKIGFVGLLVALAMLEGPSKPVLKPTETKIEQPASNQSSELNEPELVDVEEIKQSYLNEINNLKTQLASLQELNVELSKELELSKLTVNSQVEQAEVSSQEAPEVPKEQSAIESAKAVNQVRYYQQPVLYRSTYGSYYSNDACSNGSCNSGRRGLFGWRR